MKRSIKRMPKRTQEELAVLQELILSYLTDVRMIILYGSYARGEYVIMVSCFITTARFSLANRRSYRIGRLSNMRRKNMRDAFPSRGFANVFPENTPEEKVAFEKLCRAYIDARYSLEFTVSKEQYEYMLARTEVLREVTIRECAARMAYYDKMIEKEEKGIT